jgi:hypothetical protein
MRQSRASLGTPSRHPIQESAHVARPPGHFASCARNVDRTRVRRRSGRVTSSPPRSPSALAAPIAAHADGPMRPPQPGGPRSRRRAATVRTRPGSSRIRTRSAWPPDRIPIFDPDRTTRRARALERLRPSRTTGGGRPAASGRSRRRRRPAGSRPRARRAGGRAAGVDRRVARVRAAGGVPVGAVLRVPAGRRRSRHQRCGESRQPGVAADYLRLLFRTMGRARRCLRDLEGDDFADPGRFPGDPVSPAYGPAYVYPRISCCGVRGARCWGYGERRRLSGVCCGARRGRS